MQKVAGVLAAMMIVAGCGGSNTRCDALTADPIDEARSCIGASENIAAARLCYDEVRLFAKSSSPVCLIDPQNRLYLAGIQSASGCW